MNAGTKVPAILGAKAACCGLLLLAFAGTLSGAFAWFFGRPVAWLAAAALVVGIAAFVWRGGGGKSRRSKTASPRSAEAPPPETCARPPRQFG